MVTAQKQQQTVFTFSGNECIDLLGKQGLPSISNAVTIECWTKGSNLSEVGTQFFAAYGASDDQSFNIHLPWWSSSVSWIVGRPNTGGEYDKIEKQARVDEYQDTWTHWAFVKDVATGLQAIYRNGGVWHQGTNCFKTFREGNFCKIFLGSSDIGCNNWTGSITEFRIWNVARSQADITKDIGRRLKGDEQGLVLCWPLNEGFFSEKKNLDKF